jgi:antagonist of KipI
MIVIQRAPAYATVQDLGRTGFRASGVPGCGAMDPFALATLNILVGNDRGDAGFELALTGGIFVFDTPMVFAFGGAEATARLAGKNVETYRAHRAAQGEILTIENPSAGRFLYLTVGGGINIEPVLGSRSTYLPGGFGGLSGRRLKAGDVVSAGARTSPRKHQVADSLPQKLRPPFGTTEVRFIPRLDVDADEVAGSYQVSPSSDRTGYRLDGNPRTGGASITSEPVCPGVIQLPTGGQPIVLMADAPTVGGYRVAGGVITADLGLLAQKNPGERVDLVPISIEKAQRELERLVEIEGLIEEWCLS